MPGMVPPFRLQRAATYARPINGGAGIVFDTTLNKLLVWSGTEWTDVSGAPSATSYTGPVATSAVAPSAFLTSPKQMMNRSRHVATDAITSLQVIFPNFYVTGAGVETSPGAAATITASIEYPAGTMTQVKFSASASGSIPSGGTLLSDACTVAIPSGATFWVRSYFTSTAGIVYCNGVQEQAAGEVFNSAVSGLADLTMSGTVTSTGDHVDIYRPIAILGSTRKPTVAILGDSRAAGYLDTPNGNGLGEIARGLSCGYITIATPGDSVQNFVAGHAARLPVAQYCSHVVAQWSINDLSNNRSVAQIQADLATVYGYFTGVIGILATTAPRTTSTDSWATVANQTPFAQEASRVTLNTWKRTVPAPWAATWEVADQVESARNSGRWTPGLTTDGLHENQAGYILASAGVTAGSQILQR
jgi:hypothetical protein